MIPSLLAQYLTFNNRHCSSDLSVDGFYTALEKRFDFFERNRDAGGVVSLGEVGRLRAVQRELVDAKDALKVCQELREKGKEVDAAK